MHSWASSDYLRAESSANGHWLPPTSFLSCIARHNLSPPLTSVSDVSLGSAKGVFVVH